MMFSACDGNDIVPRQSINDTWTSNNGTILPNIPLSINSTLAELIESPGIHFSILSDGEGMVTPGANGTDLLESEFARYEVIKTCSLNDTAAQLELLAVSPGVDFSLGCQGKDMVYSTDDLSHVFECWEKRWTRRQSRG